MQIHNIQKHTHKLVLTKKHTWFAWGFGRDKRGETYRTRHNYMCFSWENLSIEQRNEKGFNK